MYHYDVQTELVDHLANDIEDLWSKSPGLTFEDARDKSFKKFGVFGFMDVLEAKQKQMNKRYWKIILRFGKEWFTIPKTMTTIFIFLGFYFFLQLQYAEFIFIGTLLTLILLEFILLFKSRKLNKRVKKRKKISFRGHDWSNKEKLHATLLYQLNTIYSIPKCFFTRWFKYLLASFFLRSFNTSFYYFLYHKLCYSAKSRRIVNRNLSRI